MGLMVRQRLTGLASPAGRALAPHLHPLKLLALLTHKIPSAPALSLEGEGGTVTAGLPRGLHNGCGRWWYCHVPFHRRGKQLSQVTRLTYGEAGFELRPSGPAHVARLRRGPASLGRVDQLVPPHHLRRTRLKKGDHLLVVGDKCQGEDCVPCGPWVGTLPTYLCLRHSFLLQALAA